MHPPAVREQAMRLIAAGINDCEISRRIGIPRSTVREMRRPKYIRRLITETCPRCWRAAKPIRFTPEDYSELLGLYLGDGCISPGARTSRLRLAMDAKYPQVIADAKSLLERSFPVNPVGLVSAQGGTMFYVSVYCSHLGCLFPQHRPGKKHERRIVLESWQDQLLQTAPWPFLRGCIRSDGCAFINRTGPYEYLSYDFNNLSKDIVDLFAYACDLVGITDYRVTSGNSRGRWDVRINRRKSVAEMLEHVGLKH